MYCSYCSQQGKAASESTNAEASYETATAIRATSQHEQPYDVIAGLASNRK